MEKLADTKWIWQLSDSCLCLVVFFPSMVFYWRGIWDLFGVYIFPEEKPKCHWVTTGLGACSIVGYFYLPLLRHLLQHQSWPVRVIVTRLYMYCYGVLAMAYWRGVWSLADYYLLEYGWKSGVIGLVISHVILLGLRCSRTTIFPPFVVSIDTRNDLLVPSTCFQTQVNWSVPLSVFKYIADSFLTQYVILTATIVTWRSSLSLLDLFIFPNDALISNVSCFAIGVAGSIILFALETPFHRLGTHLERTRWRWTRFVYEDVVYVIVFVTESFLWRGGWNLNAQFILPDPQVGGWVNHVIGTVLLMSLQLFSYASGCGCAKDGQDETVRDAIYSTKYIRDFMAQREKVTGRERSLMGNENNVEQQSPTNGRNDDLGSPVSKATVPSDTDVITNANDQRCYYHNAGFSTAHEDVTNA